MKKILIIRFSSIGDIVLTTPVVRCLKKKLHTTEIHFCTKKQFSEIVEASPYIDKVHHLEDSLSTLASQLRQENFDLVVDLHNNLRSALLKNMLLKPSKSFYKLNLEKWLMVKFNINRLPNIHIVDRYLETVSHLNVMNDGEGLDYFIAQGAGNDEIILPKTHQDGYIALVIGGKHQTKIFPAQKAAELCRLLPYPILIAGGKEDAQRGNEIAGAAPEKILNTCGKLTLHQSAALIRDASLVITNDTGLMHIAAAFRKKIISLWGNTIPEFGMYPYLPDQYRDNSKIFEVKGLKCRPCSKLGHVRCPLKHFDCMEKIDVAAIAEIAISLLKQ